MPRILALTLVLALGACGQIELDFSPPLLMDSSGLEGRVELVGTPLAFGEIRTAFFPDAALFGGHVLAASSSARLGLYLESDLLSAVALYGPRSSQGLYGNALAWTRGRGPLALEAAVGAGGDYLVLVAALEPGGGERYLLRADCLDACDPPVCPALACGLYCPAGLLTGADGCPSCACAPGCVQDADCPLGWICESGRCRLADPCDCRRVAYEPVCGADGRTYANTCELACAEVALAHQGACEQECASDADCPAGMVCDAATGHCELGCDCGGEPVNPVCGTDGMTYTNDCERRCAGVGLDHLGACQECSPEICDGLDNDCDGFVDEGCGGSCQTDDDCPTGFVCSGGICVQGLPCSANADCPAGQVCIQGLCRTECGVEICDGLDNDCDGATDEGCPACRSDADCAPGESCIDGLCAAICSDSDGDGYQAESCGGADCDDADSAVYPGAPELCNGRDDDCDGAIDEGCAECTEGEQVACGTDEGECSRGLRTCSGGGWGPCEDAVWPQTEICDGLDNDCDGWTDESCSVPCSSDSDCAAGQVCLDGVCIVP
ncbi:MAG: hypothetical protein JXR96_14080 [Deltaproteobacteria bacterium]|nr:hypothetical protein [Deltaproteobacteria bacterium]